MKTYLVGGAVRDQLLGLPVVERDWVVVGSTPEEMASLGYRQVGRDFPVFLHPETSEEYALARTERKTGPGHRGFVCHAGPEVTLTEDLERRDLTINAIALDDTGALIDPWGGHADLNARILRHVSPAFSEDPLRVFRVARFAARFHDRGFLVADETLTLMRAMASDGELAELSAERVWAEFDKSLRTHAPSVFVGVLEDAHSLTPWFAELAGAIEDIGVLLDRAAAEVPETAERFATLGWHLEAPSISALAARLKAPKRHARLAQHIAEHGRTLVNWRSAADDAVLEALTAVNAFRQPEWLISVVAVLNVCAQLDTSGLLALGDELRAVDPAALIQQGYKGAALGEALADRRREAIANRRVAPS